MIAAPIYGDATLCRGGHPELARHHVRAEPARELLRRIV